MAVEIQNHGNRITAVLFGDIDHHNLIFIRSEIDAQLELSTPKLLILDFSGVGFMDSSGIGLILGRMRLMKSWGGTLAVKNADGYTQKIIKLAGLGGLIIDAGKEVVK